MQLSQKCQYALRATFELAKRHGGAPVSAREIGAIQAIPVRFLELILRQLRQGGFLESRRGMEGGYLLAVPPEQLTAGDIIRYIEGPLAPVKCLGAQEKKERCPLLGECAFMDMWERAKEAVESVYDTTTFQKLVDDEQKHAQVHVANYCI